MRPLDPSTVEMLELQSTILDRIVARLDLDSVPLARLGEEELWQKTEQGIVDLVDTMVSSGDLPKSVDQDQLIKASLNEALGLGPLEDLLADDEVDEIVVDRRERILVRVNGVLKSASTAFSSEETLRRVVERLVAPTGLTIDDGSPIVDVRLRDGTRLSAAVSPVAVRGACLTLRKPTRGGVGLQELIARGTLSPAMGDFLTTCIAARRNVLICGSPDADKISLISALASAVPDGERIVSVEQVAELAIARDGWVPLEAVSTGNGNGAVTMSSVLSSALGMRPDRLIVSDVRGAEALELLSAMASSADGAIVASGGDSAHAALERVTTMARLGAPGASVDALRSLCAAAIHVVVHVALYADGVSRVASIEEVQGGGADGYNAQQLFCFSAAGRDFAAAGIIPGFYAELEARGIPADTTIFRT